MSNNLLKERGAVNPLLIASIVLGVAAASFGGAFIWAYGNFQDQKNNVDSKIEKAVTEAKKSQQQEDSKQFVEKEKQPYRQLVGPDELGRVTISYPKTWSVYVAKDGQKGGAYEAYLNPGTVPTVSGSQPYAARVVVSDQNYETAVRSFDGLVKRGDLRSSPITVNNFTGVRLDGKFGPSRTGSAVLFKVRDKTLTVASDADEFKGDFDEVIIKSLDFNP